MKVEFLEQPCEYHRFRYESEVTDGKLGGLLYARNGSKSYVRLRVSGIDPLLHKNLIVVAATVNPDLYPHPYYIIGDNCSNGAFQLKKDVASLNGKTEFDFCLEKVSLVCVSTKGAKLQEAIENRKKINFNPFNKNIDEAKYNSRNLRSLRLAFQVYYTNYEDKIRPTNAIVASEVITYSSQKAKLVLYDIHPNEVSVPGTQEIWAYFDEPLQHAIISDYAAEIRAGENGTCLCSVTAAKKNLLIISKPAASDKFKKLNERTKCNLLISDTKNGVSAQTDLILTVAPQLFDPFEVAAPVDSPAKRKRAEPANPGDENLPDLSKLLTASHCQE